MDYTISLMISIPARTNSNKHNIWRLKFPPPKKHEFLYLLFLNTSFICFLLSKTILKWVKFEYSLKRNRTFYSISSYFRYWVSRESWRESSFLRWHRSLIWPPPSLRSRVLSDRLWGSGHVVHWPVCTGLPGSWNYYLFCV